MTTKTDLAALVEYAETADIRNDPLVQDLVEAVRDLNHRITPPDTRDVGAPQRKIEWWLLTGGFMESPVSKLFSGPYSTQEDAFVARATIEQLRGANDLFVDSRDVGPVEEVQG